MRSWMSSHEKTCAPLVPPTPCLGPSWGRPPTAMVRTAPWFFNSSDAIAHVEEHMPSWSWKGVSDVLILMGGERLTMTMFSALKGCGVLVSFLFLSNPMTEKPW